MKKDFEDRDFIREQAKHARDLRAKRGFPGLENPFASIQEKMLLDYREAAAISHPGDKGTAREGVLRAFLKEKAYLPARYAVSDGSSHIISPTGHSSAQMDLVLFDAMNTPRLLSMGDIQFFPIECVYGVIEVKSDLDSVKVIEDGLNKIATFKTLQSPDKQADAGFGILFAYDASLKWKSVMDAVEHWQNEHSSNQWPNLVVVLNQAAIAQVNDRRLALSSKEIAAITAPALMPVIADDSVMLEFYLFLMDLLSTMTLRPASIRQYVSLPAIAGKHSVSFGFGHMGEIGHCSKHGQYLRKISEKSVERILAECKHASKFNPRALLSEAHGDSDILGGRAQSGGLGGICLYNPEGCPVPDILTKPQKLKMDGKEVWTEALAYDPIFVDDQEYWIPLYYALKHDLIEGCPKCDPLEGLSELTPGLLKQCFRPAESATPTAKGG